MKILTVLILIAITLTSLFAMTLLILNDYIFRHIKDEALEGKLRKVNLVFYITATIVGIITLMLVSFSVGLVF